MPKSSIFCNFAPDMLKLRIFLAFVIPLSLLEASAQNMESIIASMPDDIMPVMTKNDRLDCIDFYKSKMPSKAHNRFGGKCSIDSLTADYASIVPTGSSRVEMRRYSYGNASLVVVAYTYAAPAKETELDMYMSDWSAFPDKGKITMPKKSDLVSEVVKGLSPDSAHKLKALLSETMMCVSIDAASGTLTSSLSFEGLSEENSSALKPYSDVRLRYAWNGRNFVRQ